MAYLGRQPNTGVRSRYIFTATASQTTFSGSDDDGKTLKYEDAAYLDVFLNGILLKPVTDYTATSKTSVVLTSGAAASDIVEIVAYDIANIADAVSAANGGTFDADVTVNGDLTVDTNTLYVDATNNRVGVGTTSPTTTGHFYSSTSMDQLSVDGTGAIETGINFKSGGTTYGQIHFNNVSPYDMSVLQQYSTGSLILGTNDTERARIISNGTTLFGTTSEYASNQTVQVNCDAIASGGSGILTSCAATSVIYHINFRNGNGGVGGIYTTGTSTGYNTSSDYRLKENIVDLDGAIDRVKQLPARRFNFIADPDTTVDGFVAHEVADVVPEAITGTKDEVDEEGNPVYQGIDQSKLVPLLTQALKDAITKIEALEARVATLENA